MAYFTDVGDLKYKVSEAVTRSMRERTKRGPPLPPVEKRSVARAVSFAGVAVLVVMVLLALGAWSAISGVFPPWSAAGECINVTARVTNTSTATFGPFTRGAALDITIENRSSNSISIPASRDVTARGATGQQYTPDSSLADQSWFFAVGIQPESSTAVQLGLASARGGDR